MHGGPGNDIFSFASFNENIDTIEDFTPGEDILAFKASGFPIGLSSGETLVDGTTFIANANPVPTTAEGTFLYDTDAWFLSWDFNGTGWGRNTDCQFPERSCAYDR